MFFWGKTWGNALLIFDFQTFFQEVFIAEFGVNLSEESFWRMSHPELHNIFGHAAFLASRCESVAQVVETVFRQESFEKST